MFKQKQLFRHNPPETHGDCFRTAIACLLEIPVNSVPHLGDKYWDQPEKWDAAMSDWLQSYLGVRMVQIAYNVELQELLMTMNHLNPGMLFLLTGTSRNGVPHMVIAGNGKIEWDPSLDDSGIVGPVDGLYWVTFLVPYRHFAKV